jgi:hypothetical protein
MKKYLIKVMLDFYTDVEVEADNVYEANKLAEIEAARIYSVFNHDSREVEPFDHATGYDPEEA